MAILVIAAVTLPLKAGNCTEPKISVNTVKRGVELKKFRHVYSYLRLFFSKNPQL